MTRDEYLKACEEHGGEAVIVNSWIFWPDGWAMENMGGATPRPPENDRQRCENQRTYGQTLLDRAVKQFDDVKRTAVAMANNRTLHGAAKAEAVERLNAIKVRVEELKVSLAAVEEERVKHLPRKMQEKLNPRQTEPDEETLQEIEAIEI